eukprot:3299318-Pyramimonas_sp.AAC.1
MRTARLLARLKLSVHSARLAIAVRQPVEAAERPRPSRRAPPRLSFAALDGYLRPATPGGPQPRSRRGPRR